jgi:hypothetical protein
MSATAIKAKRQRRTAQGMEDLLQGVLNILGEYDERISIRHLFYRCANAGLIEKTEQAYNSLRSHLCKWREQRIVPFSAFIDGTRIYYGRRVFNNLGEYLDHCASAYRSNIWRNSGYFLEVWVEKDAIGAAVQRIAGDWNLQTFICRGDPSMSALDDAADTFNEARSKGYQPVILYLGDYDESGLAIPKTIKEKLLTNHDCEVDLIRVGVNEDHITRFNLPTRPPKGDRRGESIEYAVDIDAIKPTDLREILMHEIRSFMPEWEASQMFTIEEAERETLRNINIEKITL